MTVRRFMLVFITCGAALALSDYHWLAWVICVPVCAYAVCAAWKKKSNT